MEQTKKPHPNQHKVNFYASLFCGIAQAGVFNPYDRALYLSVRDRTAFLSLVNWKHPYQGFMQAIIQRTISGGLYFFLQGEARRGVETLKNHGMNISQSQSQFFVGLTAGALNG